MSLWDRYAVPRITDWACSGNPVRRQRAKVIPSARGRVLELGVGSGLNLEHYDPASVDAVVGIDPSRELLAMAEEAAKNVSLDVSLREASAEALSFDDASFDTVVVTYSLCSIPDVAAALEESKRVLAEGGALLFVEHGLAPDASVAAWQRRLEPAWKRFGGGCHLSRDIPELIRAAGFEVESLETIYLPGPRFLNYNFWGSARPT